MIYLFLANGFEEIEAITIVDFLRRCDLPVKTVGINGTSITGSHGITVTADCDESLEPKDLEAIILPGGIPGTINLENSETVQKFIKYAYENNKYICAICAAPSILGKMGMLNNKTAACYPGYEKNLINAIISNKPVVTDGKIITARAAGHTLSFVCEIAAALAGRERADIEMKKIAL